MSEMEPAPGEAVEFVSASERSVAGYASVAGAAGLLLVSIGGFFIALRTSPDVIRFHFMTTLPAIIAVGLFVRGYSALRSPNRVILGKDELVVSRGQRELGRWRWESIALAETESAAMSGQRVLKVFGAEGKALVALSSDILCFDVMVQQVKRRLAERASPLAAVGARRKARRTGIFLTLAGTAFLALAAANIWMALNDKEEAELLRTSAVSAEAVIVRKFTAPDGQTRRIEYRVNVPGAPLENVEVEPLLWPFLQENEMVAVSMVKDRPEISRLAAGQVEDEMQADPRMMIGLSAAIGIFALVIIVVGVIGLMGREIKLGKE